MWPSGVEHPVTRQVVGARLDRTCNTRGLARTRMSERAHGKVDTGENAVMRSDGDIGGRALERVATWFTSQEAMAERFADAIRQSFDEVFDGQRTGRYDLQQLSKVEKTYIGTKIEIVVQSAFGLARGRRMDFLIVGEEVDAKWSMKSGGWMIPTEAVGELCLCLTADDERSTFSVGLTRADDGALKSSTNKDRKRRFTREALASMRWLVIDGQLPDNLLLHLDPAVRSRILDHGLSGQARVDQLFRLVQQEVVRREVVLTVARQDDGPKRVRDARKKLAGEGIIVLGHQKAHPGIARSLGLPVPAKGSWISARLVRSDVSGPGVVVIEGKSWRLATEHDPVAPGPAGY